MVTIRPMAADDDFAAVARIYVESWQHAYRGLVPQRYLDKLSPEAWSSLLRADPAASLLALEGERIIGTAYITYARDEAREGCGELVALYLLPDSMGKGYGKALWAAAADRCREQGLNGLCLWVLAGNTRACRFYRAMGMEATGRTRTEAIGGERLPLTEYFFPLNEH